MNSDEYTPECVCRAMGLASFADDDALGKEGQALRIVFLPSFHPEVAATFQPSDTDLSISLTALQSMLWRERAWAQLPGVSTVSSAATPVLQELVVHFETAHASLDSIGRGIAIDGMTVAACLYQGQDRLQFKVHADANEAVHQFAVEAVKAAWNANTDPQVANALAAVARYVNLDYPTSAVPPARPLTRLLILGTPEDRKDYFEMLNQAKDEQREQAR